VGGWVGGWNPFCFIVVVVVCTVARKLRGWEEGDGVEGGGRFGLGEWGRRWRGLGDGDGMGGGRGLLDYYGGTTCVPRVSWRTKTVPPFFVF